MMRHAAAILLKISIILTVLIISASCWQLNNPVDPEAEQYQGYRIERIVTLEIKPGELTLFTDVSEQLFAVLSYEDGSSDTVNSDAVWTSSNPAVATVDTNGVITTLTTGITTISAQYDSNSTELFNTSLHLEVIVPFTGMYVAGYGSDSTGDGSHINPWATIQKGITEADLGGLNAVYVAQNQYDLDDVSGPINLIEGVSVYGGFKAGVWIHDPEVYKTGVRNISTTVTASTNPNTTFRADAGITSSTEVAGFYLRGGGGDYSAGFACYGGGSPTIHYNAIHGGEGAVESRGVDIDGSNPIIDRCLIIGGELTDTSRGIRITNASVPEISACEIDGGESASTSAAVHFDSSNGTVQNCTLRGGSSSSTYGVFASNSSPLIHHNQIGGGRGSSNSYGIFCNTASLATIYANGIIGGQSSGGSARGITAYNNSDIAVYNNTIAGGGGVSAYGIFIYLSNPTICANNSITSGYGQTSSYGIYLYTTSPPIENNIIFCDGTGSQYGIYEFDASSDPSSLQNNNIYDCSDGLYYDFDTGLSYQGVNTSGNFSEFSGGGGVLLATPAGSGNVTVPLEIEPGFRIVDAVNPADLPLVTEGGLDGGALGWPFTVDKDGNPRSGDGSTGWSMGAYEYD